MTLVAGLVVLGLIAAVVFSQFQASPPPVPRPSPTPVTLSPTPSIVRTPFFPAPSASEPVTVGMIGKPVRFTGVSGTGTVTVVSAVWGTGGTLAPEEGNWYLTLELRFEGVSGQVVTGLLFTTVRDAQGESHPFAIGPTLTNGLPTRLLSKGQVSTGTVAFELPRGPVTVVILSEALEPVAEISLP
ncbi:MAG: hypothetical protein IPL43_01600 [Micropruina sp.]|nr:hypothetical protein [Micropruina sp.]